MFLIKDIAQTLFKKKKKKGNKIIWVITFLTGTAPNSLSFSYRLSCRKRQCAYHCLFLLDHTSSVSCAERGLVLSARLLLSVLCACCTPRLWVCETTCRNGAVLCILGTDSNRQNSPHYTRCGSPHLPHSSSTILTRLHTSKHPSTHLHKGGCADHPVKKRLGQAMKQLPLTLNRKRKFIKHFYGFRVT